MRMVNKFWLYLANVLHCYKAAVLMLSDTEWIIIEMIIMIFKEEPLTL